ncbi:uncharacterized protein LOC121879285 [Homarus americanus]|uniref:Uncharacterized protein n=1 Tax=Homarus americanus TaxID=6706 RepID=A0A8J5JI63_HOMAM|nr:uncharacterized protein LOC121879285 [Homarus americanus]XP_042241815.1 uncharacterized protein LOC121879285 [Homarus americanus]XP_042241816.1 uncharacterized protein LOC121879285 [Homarus americanus]KAG7158025.1 hypothetical protein Hamer_G014908 [Homarus americanus]
MACYLICLTWVLLLALCYTPAPAHSENLGLSRGHGNRHVRQAQMDNVAYYDGGVDAKNPNSGAIVHDPNSNYRPPVVFGPRPRPRPTWHYNQYNQHNNRYNQHYNRYNQHYNQPYWYYRG